MASERMIRKQIYVTPEQNRLLEVRAEQLGCTQSDVVRLALELVAAQQNAETRKGTLGDTFGLWRDRNDLPDFDALRRESDDRID